MVVGNSSPPTYGNWRVSAPDAIPPRARPSSIVNRARPIKAAHAASTGEDGGTNVRGRKRHVLVDTLGLLRKVVVHPANLHDRLGAKLVLGDRGTGFPRLQRIWADQGYAGAWRLAPGAGGPGNTWVLNWK